MRLHPVACSGCGRHLAVTPFDAGRTLYCDESCERASWVKDPGERAALLASRGRFDFLQNRNTARDSLVVALTWAGMASRAVGEVFGISGTRVRQICKFL